MSCEGILENPALFSNTLIDLDEIAQEYLVFFEKYPGEADLGHVKTHLFKILYKGL